MSCNKCFGCSAKKAGLSQIGMALLASQGITVPQIAEGNEQVTQLLQNELDNVRLESRAIAIRLLQLEPLPQLFHDRYHQPLSPLTGIASIDNFFPNNMPPKGSVIMIYEKFHRNSNSDHILANLLMGYLKLDKNDPLKYQDIDNVPLEKALYISSSRQTDLLSNIPPHPSLIGYRYVLDPITDLADVESIYDIEREVPLIIEDVKTIIIDAIKTLPFGAYSTEPVSSQWLKWLETMFGDLGDRTLVLLVDESDYPNWESKKIMTQMTNGIGNKYDVYNCRFNDRAGTWDCEVKFAFNEHE